jgi:membrane protein implicated in regulation of membrane protease activity
MGIKKLVWGIAYLGFFAHLKLMLSLMMITFLVGVVTITLGYYMNVLGITFYVGVIYAFIWVFAAMITKPPKKMRQKKQQKRPQIRPQRRQPS